jgi:hypothetical protein
MCESFPHGSDEVYILRNLASILLFVYGTRTEEARRAHDLFNQGRWEDLWKLALKAGERAKARAAKNPRQSKAKSEPQKDNTPRVNWNTTRNSGPHLNRRLIFGKAKRAGIS